MIRTSVAAEELGAEDVVRVYKNLSVVEQAFRVSKDFALEVEPIRHRRDDRIRAHVCVCRLAFYVWMHMEEALAPKPFVDHVDHDPEGGEAERTSIAAPAVRSPATRKKIGGKRNGEDEPLPSFRTLLKDLATLTKNTVEVEDTGIRFEQHAEPTRLRERAFELLDATPRL